MQANVKPTQSQREVVTPEEPESNWSRLIKGIVRPPRANYRDMQLGYKTFTHNEQQYNRIQNVVMHEGKRLDVTIFQPSNKNRWIILYLHGNSSSKLEAISIISYLPFKFALAAFDFLGCGHNKESDTISLGYRQSQQAETVAGFLKEMGYQVVLWGRSMGAASALKYGGAPIIVADSSFSRFSSLCKQIAKKNAPTYIPNFLISCLFPCVFCKLRNDVQQVGHYDIKALDIVQAVKRINPATAIIFLSGSDDSLIDKGNSQKLYQNFPGKFKYLQIFKGNHNSKRPTDVIKKIMGLISRHVEEFEERHKDLSYKTKIQLEIED